MPYVCELGAGQSIYLDNQGMQTVVTTVTSRPGQHQQASTSVQTGNWTAPPEMYRTPDGAILKVNTTNGDCYIQIQGSSVSMAAGIPAVGNAQQVQVSQVSGQQAAGSSGFGGSASSATVSSSFSSSGFSMPSMPSMQPMQPMEPMKTQGSMNLNLGGMSMSMNPMEMKMGDMEMNMGRSAQNASGAAGQTPQRRFCSQCGQPVQAGDRFCAGCGYKLS
jgi:hypothetical protein